MRPAQYACSTDRGVSRSGCVVADCIAARALWLCCQTEQCVNFARDGVCPYGPRCRFIHNLSTLDQDSLPGLGPVSTLQHAILSDPQLSPFLHLQHGQHANQIAHSAGSLASSSPHSTHSPVSPATPASSHPVPARHSASIRPCDLSLPSGRAQRALSSAFSQPHPTHLTTGHQASRSHTPGAVSSATAATRHRSQSSASSASSSVSPSYSSLLYSSVPSPAASTVYSPFSASSRFSPIDRPALSPVSSLHSSASASASSSSSSRSRPSSADLLAEGFAPHSHVAARRSIGQTTAGGHHQPQPSSQRSPHESVYTQQMRQPAAMAQSLHARDYGVDGSTNSALDAAELHSLALLSVRGAMEDEDEDDGALPSRSLVASQHALREQQQRFQQQSVARQQLASGSDHAEPRSPPLTALHALHSQSRGRPLSLRSVAVSPMQDDNASKLSGANSLYDDEKQSGSTPPPQRGSVSPWMSSSMHSAIPSVPVLGASVASSTRAVSPKPTSSLFFPASATSANTLQWSDRAASFSASAYPSSVVSTSRSSSFAAANSPLMYHSPFSASPFSPFAASALPSTPFELPRAALPPPGSPALSTASSRSSNSSANTAAQHTPHTPGSAGRQQAVDAQLLDEAQVELTGESEHDEQRSYLTLAAVSGGSAGHAGGEAAASPDGRSYSSPSSPWLHSSLHIIDDAHTQPRTFSHSPHRSMAQH